MSESSLIHSAKVRLVTHAAGPPAPARNPGPQNPPADHPHDRSHDRSPRRAAPLPPGERRAALVAATIPLITQFGTAVSTRQIAEAAGVAEGTIFRAFPDKESLISACVEAAFDPAPTVEELRKVGVELPLAERVETIAAILHGRLSAVIAVMVATRLRRPPGDERGATAGARRTASEAVHREVARLLEPDRARLRLAPEQVARVLRMMLFAGAHPGIADGKPLSPKEISAVILDGVRIGDAHTHEGGTPC